MLELFPDSARVDRSELVLGGMRAAELADRYGTPLVVYCEATLRARAREIRAAVPDALIHYGSKAFPNIAVLRLFADAARLHQLDVWMAARERVAAVATVATWSRRAP